MIKKELYFDSSDGKGKIYAVQYIPRDKEVIGVIQIAYGMAEHIGRYETFGEAMAQKGFVVTGQDYPGHGKTLKEGDVPGYFCEKDPATVVVENVHSLHKLMREEYPRVPYILLGHSMGSFVVRNYISCYGREISAAILLGTAMQGKALIGFGKTLNGIQKTIFGSKHVSKLLNYLSFGSNIKYFKPARTPSDWLTRDTQAVELYNADSLCGFFFTVNGFETLFELIGRMNRMNVMQNIPKELPVLIMAGTKDPVGNFGKGPKKLYELMKKVGLVNVHCRLYDGARHELLNETNREDVIKDICEWIGKDFLES
ncbi:MAG: alpha/beta fold hydrolase [Lachnospiraceae bacterium]|nr:alpha/beta fold hydrolase [Lachnospiraceae bacterium]